MLAASRREKGREHVGLRKNEGGQGRQVGSQITDTDHGYGSRITDTDHATASHKTGAIIQVVGCKRCATVCGRDRLPWLEVIGWLTLRVPGFALQVSEVGRKQ